MSEWDIINIVILKALLNFDPGLWTGLWTGVGSQESTRTVCMHITVSMI